MKLSYVVLTSVLVCSVAAQEASSQGGNQLDEVGKWIESMANQIGLVDALKNGKLEEWG